jgi:hypothetical protein
MLQLSCLSPADVAGQAGPENIKGTDGAMKKEKLETIRLSNPPKQSRVLFVTVLEAAAAGGQFKMTPALQAGDRPVLTLTSPQRTWTFTLLPDRKDPTEPIFEELRPSR